MDSTTAKQFLISRVLEEADVEHVPLSEIERKMLYFSEVHPSLPAIYEVNAEFERNYDADEYEDKVAGLLKRARDRDQNDPLRRERWTEAFTVLKGEDHYILVMVHQAFGVGSASDGHRFRDFLIYIAIAVGLVLIASIWKAFH